MSNFRAIQQRLEEASGRKAAIAPPVPATRAYIVKRQILEWKSGESYKSYNPATNKLANGLDNVVGESVQFCSDATRDPV
jgi:hypothetical protein